STWWNNPCWQAQTSDFSCSWSPGLHTSQEGFWSTPLCRSSPNPSGCVFNGREWGNEVQAQYSTLHGPIHSPLDAVESSCTLGRETAPKHNVSTSMLDGGDGVIFSILTPPNAASRVDAKELDFGHI